MSYKTIKEGMALCIENPNPWECPTTALVPQKEYRYTQKRHPRVSGDIYLVNNPNNPLEENVGVRSEEFMRCFRLVESV